MIGDERALEGIDPKLSSGGRPKGDRASSRADGVVSEVIIYYYATLTN